MDKKLSESRYPTSTPLSHQSSSSRQPQATCENTEDSLNLSKISCVSELLTNPDILRTYVYIPGLFKCIFCHNLNDESGIGSPILDEYCYESNGKRTSKKFRNCKRSLQVHLRSPCHKKNVSEYNEQDYYDKKKLAHQELAGITAGILMYQMVKSKDSYRSYEDRITALHLMPGTVVGDKNHSKETPPKFIRTMRDVLKKSMKEYISGLADHISFVTPISITADKDTSKHRSRQVKI